MRRVEKQLRQLIREELDVNDAQTFRRVCGHPSDHHLNEQLAQLAGAYLNQMYGGEADKQGLTGTERASYLASRGVLGATQSGATQVAKQGVGFYTSTMKDVFLNKQGEMLDWGITGAALAASMFGVGKVISIGLDSASFLRNVAEYVAKDYQDVGPALGAVLDLIGISVAVIGDAAKAMLQWVKSGMQIPENLAKWFAGKFIGAFGSKTASILAWLGRPEAGMWLKQSMEQFSKFNAQKGAAAVAQKFIADFMIEKELETAFSTFEIMSKVNAGLQMAKITLDDKIKKTIEVGVASFTKLINRFIADAFKIMIFNSLKAAYAVS